jgi:hypothetical protein
MEWPVLETLSKDPRYLKLLHELNFPKTEWSVN